MHIGLFTDCYAPQVNGVVTSVEILEKELIARGHKVTVVTVAVPEYIDEKDNVLRIPSLPFTKCKEFRLGIPLYNETYRKIKRLGLDVIHTHTEFTVGMIGKHLASILNIPIVHTYHTMYEDYTHYVFDHKYGKGIVKKIITSTSKRYVRKYDGIIAPSEKTRTALRSYGVQNEIYVVPTGIDVEAFSHQYDQEVTGRLREKHGIAEDDFVLLSLGRVSKEKSVDVLIRQMPRILKFIPKAKLVIVGDGPFRQTLEYMVDEMKLNDHISFIGQVPFEDVGKYYCMADLFVNASQSETQGLTIIEAMASRIPIIVYDDLNIKGIVEHGVSGRLFKEESQLGSQVISAYNNITETQAITEQGFQKVQALSKEIFGESIEHVYKALNHKAVMSIV